MMGYGAAALILYAVSMISAPLQYVLFLVINGVLAFFGYRIGWKQCLLSTAILSALMAATEVVITFAGRAIFRTPWNAASGTMVFISFYAKTLFFLLILILSKISFREQLQTRRIAFHLPVFLLPVSSLLVLFCLLVIDSQTALDMWQYTLFMFVALFLLLSNAVVFLVIEKSTRIMQENLSLQMENQRNAVNRQYYENLQRQYEASAILIHDIKRHLNNLAGLAGKEDHSEILQYIQSISQTVGKGLLKTYSGNRLVNVILTRYDELCRGHGIETDFDVRNIDFSFLSDHDLTAILDNLLENAYEAAASCPNGYIRLQIGLRNRRFIVIRVENSCIKKPDFQNGVPRTTKRDGLHGYGIKSIQNAARRYGGDLEFFYFPEKSAFTTVVLLCGPQSHSASPSPGTDAF